MQAYCIKCKQKQELVNGTLRYTITGHPQEVGQCQVCNTKIMRFLSKAERQAILDKQKIAETEPKHETLQEDDGEIG